MCGINYSINCKPSIHIAGLWHCCTKITLWSLQIHRTDTTSMKVWLGLPSTCLTMLWPLLHKCSSACTYIHIYIHRQKERWIDRSGFPIDDHNPCPHTHRTVRSPSVERSSSPWKCMKPMSSANSSLQDFFTHALCRQYCMSGLKQSGAKLPHPTPPPQRQDVSHVASLKNENAQNIKPTQFWTKMRLRPFRPTKHS